MEIARLEIELGMLQMRETRHLDGLREILEEILRLEMQELEKILSVELSPSLEEKAEDLRNACLTHFGMQEELLEKEKSLNELQASQLQEECNKIPEGKDPIKARLACLKKELQIANHFKTSLEKKWKHAVKSLTRAKCGAIKLEASPCMDEAFIKCYLDQRLGEKAEELTRLQRHQSRFEEKKGPLLEDKIETGTKSPTYLALQEIAAKKSEKQRLELQYKSMKERKQEKLDHLEKAKENLERLKIGKKPEELQQSAEAALDEEICTLEARIYALQHQVAEKNDIIRKTKDEISQLQFRIATKSEADQPSELDTLRENIDAAKKQRSLLVDKNAALSAEIEEIGTHKYDTTKSAENEAKINEELKQMESRIKTKENSNQTRAAKIKELQQEIAELGRNIDESNALREKVMNSSRLEMEALQAEIATLESNLKLALEAGIKTDTNIQETQGSLSELEFVLAEKKRIQEDLKSQMDAVSKENELAMETLRVFEEHQRAEELEKRKEAAKGLLPWLWGRSSAEDGQTKSSCNTHASDSQKSAE